MSLIPDKNLFIVTSCLKPSIGTFTDAIRYDQTISTLNNLRQKLPEAIIVFVDCSTKPLTDEEKMELGKRSNIFIDMSQEPNCKFLTDRGMKSEAENMMLFHTLVTLKNNPQISNVLNSVKRIFKYSSRSGLEDSFDIKEYDGLFGKFVFKKRIPTWLNQAPLGADHLFITRLYSFCPSLIDIYLEIGRAHV